MNEKTVNLIKKLNDQVEGRPDCLNAPSFGFFEATLVERDEEGYIESTKVIRHPTPAQYKDIVLSENSYEDNDWDANLKLSLAAYLPMIESKYLEEPFIKKENNTLDFEKIAFDAVDGDKHAFLFLFALGWNSDFQLTCDKLQYVIDNKHTADKVALRGFIARDQILNAKVKESVMLAQELDMNLQETS